MKVNDTVLTMSDSCRKLIINSGCERIVNVLMPSVVSASGVYSITLTGRHDIFVNIMSSDNEGIIYTLGTHERTAFLTTNGCEWFLLSATNICY